MDCPNCNATGLVNNETLCSVCLGSGKLLIAKAAKPKRATIKDTIKKIVKSKKK